jgi:predicted DNA repair protein MutK
MTLTWTADWVCGLSLIALTIMVHVSGLIGIAVVLRHLKTKLKQRHGNGFPATLLAVPIIGFIGWALAVLHGLSAAIWAAAYLALGAIDRLGDAMFYSVDSMTARGASGLELHPHWRLMGALEAANGLLLFGISTAFLATVIVEFWELSRGTPNAPK